MNKAAYKHLLSTYGRKLGFWFGVAMELVRSLCLRIFSAFFMAQAVSNVVAGDVTAAKRNVLFFLIIFCVGVILGSCGDLVAFYSENLEYRRLLMDYYSKLTGKDMSFYRDNQTGYLASAFRQYLDAAIVLVRFFRTNVLGTLVTLLAPVVVLLFSDWRVGLIALAIVFVQFIYVSWSSAKANKYRSMTHEAYRKLTGEVADDITNVVALKSSGQDQSRRIETIAKAETTAFRLMRKTNTLLELPRSIITAAGVAFVFYIIISRSSSSPAAVGLIVLTMTYMLQVIRSVADLPDLIQRHDDLITKLSPTLQYLNLEHEDIKDPQHPKKLAVTKGAIGIKQVDFSYQSRLSKHKRIDVFKKLNVEIAGGERLGVVGLSGMGKSTLASLLMRFDDVNAGSIEIDGIDLREVEQTQLRQKIAYVPQEPLLFHRSVKDNIAYFNPAATHQNIIKVAKAAHAHEFIERLPDGYNTIVGERGLKLSGGQKQRVVIARAILKNAPIMIFDEATSALDTESEQIIQQALPEIIGTQTAIIIAHRLSTVAGLDRIIVIHDGSVEEEGTHSQLLIKKGRYYKLWQKQVASKS
jgi:ATP-binding cassette, subfamily B, bacterial